MKPHRGGPKKKKRSKSKNKQNLNKDEPEELKSAPHSFVFCRGTVGENVSELARDFRKVMEPFTASSLKARKANCLKDFLSVSGLLHVSHMCIFTSTDINTYLKIVRAPRGPTLYFKVLNYCLSKDVISSLKKQLVFKQQFLHPPLLIMNNFSGDGMQFELTTSMFQNMFPSINLTKINLNNVRRCVLLNYNSSTDEIDFRHYSIKVVPVDISKGVKKMVQNKVPNLSKFEDPADFIAKGHLLSESEGEDDPDGQVTLPQKISSRGNSASARSSIRLIEQGPRMTLQLFKIEEGFVDGETLYHKTIVKTEEEKMAILERRLERRRIKEQRKKGQEERVKAKQFKKTKLKEKSLKGMKKEEDKNAEKEDDVDDDAEWFKNEVGHEPDDHLFNQTKKKGDKRKMNFREFVENKKKTKKIKRS